MRAGHKSKGHRKCPLHDLTLTCRIFLSRIIKIAPFLLTTKVGQQLIRTFLSMSYMALLGCLRGGGVCSTGKLMCKM